MSLRLCSHRHESTQFEKTPYKQLMEGKIVLIYAEVCGVALLVSLLSFAPLFVAHGKYILPAVHFGWCVRRVPASSPPPPVRPWL